MNGKKKRNSLWRKIAILTAGIVTMMSMQGGADCMASEVRDLISICDFEDQRCNPNNYNVTYFNDGLAIDGDYIYFDANMWTNEGDNKFLYRIRMDGTDMRRVSDWCYDSLNFYDDYCFVTQVTSAGMSLEELHVSDTGYRTNRADYALDGTWGSEILQRVEDTLIYGVSLIDEYIVYARDIPSGETHVICKVDEDVTGSAVQAEDGYLYLLLFNEEDETVPASTDVWRISRKDLSSGEMAVCVAKDIYCWLPHMVTFTKSGVYRLNMSVDSRDGAGYVTSNGQIEYLAFADINPMTGTWPVRTVYGSPGKIYQVEDLTGNFVIPFGDNLLVVYADENASPKCLRFYLCPDMDLSQRQILFPFVPDSSGFYHIMQNIQWGVYDNVLYMILPAKENRTFFFIRIQEDGTYQYSKLSENSTAQAQTPQNSGGAGNAGAGTGTGASNELVLVPSGTNTSGVQGAAGNGTNTSGGVTNTSGGTADTTGSSDYVIEKSDRVYLTEADVQNLSLQQINYAKNEIYARRGRLFKSWELQNYFNSKPWYHGTIQPEEFTEAYAQRVMNTYEYTNAAFLAKVEFSRDPNGYQLDQ
ncbi:MAG: YARHG domain-containing protein [Candidatus Choladocola sp.]|nr:YARHG domain-containing protein [Candidatus Choladocola sp.]